MIDSLLDVSGLPKDDPAFLAGYARMVERLGWRSEHADWLLATISFESGFNPKAVNPYSKATGLIQFMPKTAQNLGTTVDALRTMSRLEQLPYVEKYFSGYKGGLIAPSDIPLAIFYPAGIGKGDAYVLFEAGSKAYEQNRALDREDKGFITVGDYKEDVAHRFVAAQDRPRIPVPLSGEPGGDPAGGRPDGRAVGSFPVLLGGGLLAFLVLLFKGRR